jgi:hypothetical protein
MADLAAAVVEPQYRVDQVMVATAQYYFITKEK